MAYAKSSQQTERRKSQVANEHRRLSQVYSQRMVDGEDDRASRFNSNYHDNHSDDDRLGRFDEDRRNRYDDDPYNEGRRKSDRRIRYDDDSDDDYRNHNDRNERKRYDDDTDYIGMAVNHTSEQEPKRTSGRLAPLKVKETSKGKKKKKGLLKKLAKNQEEDYDDDLL